MVGTINQNLFIFDRLVITIDVQLSHLQESKQTRGYEISTWVGRSDIYKSKIIPDHKSPTGV